MIYTIKGKRGVISLEGDNKKVTIRGVISLEGDNKKVT
jgi:hypothetical protein